VIDIAPIRKQGCQSSFQFQGVDFYLDAAKKAIGYFAPPQYVHRMLKSEDVIANVANEIMMGEMRWKEGGGQSRSSFRLQCGKWAIFRCIRRNKREKSRPLDYNIHGEPAENLGPSARLLRNETLERMKDLLDTEGVLTEKQRVFIMAKYLKGQTLKQIGKDNQCSVTAVRHHIKSGLHRLKKALDGYSTRL